MLPRGARSIKVANGLEAEVEAITEFHLQLHSGFVLCLRDVLYVPSLQRNLISVLRLDDDSIDCHFGDGKCEILFYKECVVLPFYETSYTCFHYMRMLMLLVLRIRIPPHMRMLLRNANELMQSY